MFGIGLFEMFLFCLFVCCFYVCFFGGLVEVDPLLLLLFDYYFLAAISIKICFCSFDLSCPILEKVNLFLYL